MEQGWVYVLVNSSIPGMVKVGRTTRPPAERAAELSAATGVATPFVVAFEQVFPDCLQAERDIHEELESRGIRIASNREFFGGPAADIIRVVLKVAADKHVGPDLPPAGRSALELLAEGDRHLFGEGDTFEDPAEACRFYKLAASRGSVVAPERLGAVYRQRGGRSTTERHRAMRYFREGARRGNYYCYVEMAMVFAADPHKGNFVKSWARFFAVRATNPCEEAEAGEFRYVSALQRYVSGCIDLAVPPAHVAELAAASAPLIDHLLAALKTSQDREQKARLAGALRWIYQTVCPPVQLRVSQTARLRAGAQKLETA